MHRMKWITIIERNIYGVDMTENEMNETQCKIECMFFCYLRFSWFKIQHAVIEDVYTREIEIHRMLEKGNKGWLSEKRYKESENPHVDHPAKPLNK